MKSTKAVVLSSGGCDSTVTLAIALSTHNKEDVVTVSVSYGQKHSRELECAQKISEYYGVRHEVIDLSQIFKYSNCSLLQQSDKEVPEGSYAEQIDKTESGIVSTYVPGRNALMLCSVASLGMSIFPDDDIVIYLGNHADDAAGNAYPDCSEEFSDAIAKAIYVGSGKQVTVATPLVSMNKAEVVATGLKYGVPFELTTSCYNGQDTACSCCGTCVDRINAFRANKVIDPIKYAVDIDWTGCKEYKR